MQAANYMKKALKLAKKASNPSPNPKVGCIIVRDGKIVGQGHHRFAGDHHAEIHALNAAKSQAEGATAYVTLEPCCHFGRTPPCTNALINAKVKEVYIATLDANPKVAGKGLEILRAHGIKTHVGLLESEAQHLNAAFFHFMLHGSPLIMAKWAMSLDGKTITSHTDDKKISCERSTKHAHVVRSEVDAILIGGKTAREDNPRLTARTKTVTKQPLRIVLSKSGKLDPELNIFQEQALAKTLLVTQTMPNNLQKFTDRNIEILHLPFKDDTENLHFLIERLGARSIMSLLVEGGMNVVNGFLKYGLVDQLHVYLAPKLIADFATKKNVPQFKITKLAGDLFINVMSLR